MIQKVCTRRPFIKNTALSSVALSTPSVMTFAAEALIGPPMSRPKISLAQWSLHRAFEEGQLKAVDFAGITKNDYGIEAVEKEDINVHIENHGLHTSDGAFIVDIIKEVDNPHLGTLPDFGNWCLNAEWGSTANNKCTEVYDPYQGVANFLPFAKGVSAKSYSFEEQGDETGMGYKRLLQMVKNTGYEGYIGIEYEGEELSEDQGIKATKALIEKVWKELD